MKINKALKTLDKIIKEEEMIKKLNHRLIRKAIKEMKNDIQDFKKQNGGDLKMKKENEKLKEANRKLLILDIKFENLCIRYEKLKTKNAEIEKLIKKYKKEDKK